MPGILYIGADNDVILDTWTNSRTAILVPTGATVTLTLYRRLCMDAVTTASSTTISSVGAPFVSGDAARSVVVVGAAANGADLRTTIASYTSASAVVLTVAPSVSTTNTEVRLSVTDATGVSMSFVEAGKYRGVIDDSVMLKNGDIYWIEISGDTGSDVIDFRSFDVVAKYRE